MGGLFEGTVMAVSKVRGVVSEGVCGVDGIIVAERGLDLVYNIPSGCGIFRPSCQIRRMIDGSQFVFL